MRVEITEAMTESAPPAVEPTDNPPAWEEIESGRFQPRRIRGSCRGRVLG